MPVSCAWAGDGTEARRNRRSTHGCKRSLFFSACAASTEVGLSLGSRATSFQLPEAALRALKTPKKQVPSATDCMMGSIQQDPTRP